MSLKELSVGLTFNDVLIVPQRSSIRSRSDVSLRTRFSRHLELEIPLVAANMDTVCEHEMAIAMARLGGLGVIHRFMGSHEQAAQVSRVKSAGDFQVGAAVGADGDMVQRAKRLADAGTDALVLDIAHGHSDHAIDGVATLKDHFAGLDVVAGNVATAEGAVDLIAAGADAVKVGVGPGSVCITRTVAGVGVPQLSAIAEVVEVAGDIPVIADGGVRSSGDIAKALGAGAASVMVGGMLAGTKETPGEIEQGSSGLQKRFRGMASFEAIEARANRLNDGLDEEYLGAGLGEEYLGDGLDEKSLEHRAAEGVEGVMPYRGEVSTLVRQLMGGVRSALSYSNARNLTELRERIKFVGVTALGYAESTTNAEIFSR